MNINTTKQLATFIRALRKRMGISQRDLALSSGTGLRFIVDLEKGKSTCQIHKVLSVLKTLGVSIQLTAPIEFNRENNE